MNPYSLDNKIDHFFIQHTLKTTKSVVSKLLNREDKEIETTLSFVLLNFQVAKNYDVVDLEIFGDSGSHVKKQILTESGFTQYFALRLRKDGRLFVRLIVSTPGSEKKIQYTSFIDIPEIYREIETSDSLYPAVPLFQDK
jgi:hypothetical protein